MFSYASFTLLQSRNSVFCRSVKLWKSDMLSGDSVDKKCPLLRHRVVEIRREFRNWEWKFFVAVILILIQLLITPLVTLDMWLLKSFVMNWCLYSLDVYISSQLLQIFFFNWTKHFLFNIYKHFTFTLFPLNRLAWIVENLKIGIIRVWFEFSIRIFQSNKLQFIEKAYHYGKDNFLHKFLIFFCVNTV